MKSISMRALFYAAFGYLLAGLGIGLFFREFTQANDFPDSEFTQLAVVHTHLLTLGFIVLLLMLALGSAISKRRRPAPAEPDVPSLR
jgi:hypothetical protein